MNKRHLELLAMTLLCLSASTAFAADTGVECVQQALLDRGFDPNGVDGRIGDGTRSALTDFEQTAQTGLSEMNRENAWTWCGAIHGPKLTLKRVANLCRPQFKNIDLEAALTSSDPNVGAFIGEIFYESITNRVPGTGAGHSVLIIATESGYELGYFFSGETFNPDDDICARLQPRIGGGEILLDLTNEQRSLVITYDYGEFNDTLSLIYNRDNEITTGILTRVDETALREAGF